MHTSRRVVTATFAVALMLALSACESTYEASTVPVEISNEITATAQVTGVDKDARLVTLRREDGTLFQIVAPPEVRNFDQIVAGDLLRVKFKETLRATRNPAYDSGPDTGANVYATRAPVGGRPSASFGIGSSVRVRIESIDTKRDIVVFSLPSGELVSHRIATPEGHKFVEGLHIGDKVQLDYSQSLALAIDKV